MMMYSGSESNASLVIVSSYDKTVMFLCQTVLIKCL
jgi:hypothetical protein